MRSAVCGYAPCAHSVCSLALLRAFMHSFVHTVIPLFVHSFMHSCAHALMRSCAHALMRSCTQLFQFMRLTFGLLTLLRTARSLAPVAPLCAFVRSARSCAQLFKFIRSALSALFVNALHALMLPSRFCAQLFEFTRCVQRVHAFMRLCTQLYARMRSARSCALRTHELRYLNSRGQLCGLFAFIRSAVCAR